MWIMTFSLPLILLGSTIAGVQGLVVQQDFRTALPRLHPSPRCFKNKNPWSRLTPFHGRSQYVVTASSPTSDSTPTSNNNSNPPTGFLFLSSQASGHSGRRRLITVGAVVLGSFAAYLAGTFLLNRFIVEGLGVSRKGDAFGPFSTLLSLIYSIVLGQIYHYYFERQQVIQDCLYQEAAALQLLAQICRPQNQSRHILREYTQDFLQTAFTKQSSYMLRHEVLGNLADLAQSYEDDNGNTNTNKTPQCRSLLVANVLNSAIKARARRISHVNSELPAIQRITERLLSLVILMGFVLVDLNAPLLEAFLFAIIAGCFTTIHGFLMDLSDPFRGQWMVGTHIRNDLEDLLQAMK